MNEPYRLFEKMPTEVLRQIVADLPEGATTVDIEVGEDESIIAHGSVDALLSELARRADT